MPTEALTANELSKIEQVLGHMVIILSLELNTLYLAEATVPLVQACIKKVGIPDDHFRESVYDIQNQFDELYTALKAREMHAEVITFGFQPNIEVTLTITANQDQGLSVSGYKKRQ